MLDILNTSANLLPISSLEQELESAHTEIERLRELNRTLLKLVGHELGSPLTFILAYLRLWQEQRVTPALDELNLVTEQAMMLKTRLDDLMLLEQLESGRWHLAREPILLYPLIRRVVQSFTALLGDKQIAVQLSLNCTKTVIVDAEMIVRVLDHLLSNAIKFSPPKSAITISTHREGEWCCVTIADQGVGIAPEQHDRIFDAFYQPDLSLSRRYEGMGVGLKLVRSIVNGHGGDIRVESQQGKGSAFVIRLPIA